MEAHRHIWVDLGYDAWPAREGDWSEAVKGARPDDQLDFHVDLGCGTVPKARIGVDRFPAPGVAVLADLDRLVTVASAHEPGQDADAPPEGYQMAEWPGLPFHDNQVESMISHHCLEHIGDGFFKLMDECWRILKPGAPFRIIVPLFPSTTAVKDPDHRRYFMDGTFDSLCGTHEHMWCDSFMVPYCKGRWLLTDKDTTALTPPEKRWTEEDRREMRVTLRAVK